MPESRGARSLGVFRHTDRLAPSTADVTRVALRLRRGLGVRSGVAGDLPSTGVQARSVLVSSTKDRCGVTIYFPGGTCAKQGVCG